MWKVTTLPIDGEQTSRDYDYESHALLSLMGKPAGACVTITYRGRIVYVVNLPREF